MIEVQNDAMGDRASEKSGPTAVKEQPLRDRAGLQLAEEQCQQQAASTKKADGVTHAQRCASSQERDQILHRRSNRGVNSLIFDARGNRLLHDKHTMHASGDPTDAALETTAVTYQSL